MVERAEVTKTWIQFIAILSIKIGRVLEKEKKRRRKKKDNRNGSLTKRNGWTRRTRASMRQRDRIRGKAGPASGLKTDETWYSSANHFTALCSWVRDRGNDKIVSTTAINFQRTRLVDALFREIARHGFLSMVFRGKRQLVSILYYSYVGTYGDQ